MRERMRRFLRPTFRRPEPRRRPAIQPSVGPDTRGHCFTRKPRLYGRHLIAASSGDAARASETRLSLRERTFFRGAKGDFEPKGNSYEFDGIALPPVDTLV